MMSLQGREKYKAEHWKKRQKEEESGGKRETERQQTASELSLRSHSKSPSGPGTQGSAPQTMLFVNGTLGEKTNKSLLSEMSSSSSSLLEQT